MLAITSRKQIPSSFLRDFRLLAEKGKVLPGAKPGHEDGWGVVCYQKHTPIYLGRQPTNAMEDLGYEEACKNLDQLGSKGPLVAHLRKASSEYKEITLENTAPFVQDKWCFAHNGTIHNFNVRITDLNGTTDSERFFLLMLSERESSGRSIEEAIENTVLRVRDSFRYSSMTFLLSNGVRIYAYREYSNPKDSDYYNLMYAADKNRVILSQQKIWPEDWVTIPNKNLVIVMKNLKICIRSI